MKEFWWFSGLKFTVGVEVQDGRITDTAPITKKFVGQPLKNLENWMTRLGGFQKERLK